MFRCLSLRKAIHVGLGIFLVRVFPQLDRPGERHQYLNWTPLFLEIFANLKTIANGVCPAIADNHGFGPPPHVLFQVITEMIYHNPPFPLNGLALFGDKPLEEFLGLVLVHHGIIINRLEEVEVLVVGGVILQHIQNETLLDGLTHRVEAERLVGAISLLGAE